MDKEQRWLLISDSHVGDRVKRLQAKLLDDIKAKKPDLILHGGDIAVQEVLDQLGEIAPVIAVQGNRDWFKGFKQPMEHHFEVARLKIVLAHGHISMWHWFWNYVHLFLTFRIHNHQFFQRQLAEKYPEADVIIYGHLHFQYNEMMDGKRFINPGSAYSHWRNKGRPQYMLMTIKESGEIFVERHEVILD